MQECFDCGAKFAATIAFDRHQGCPECDATLYRLFEQRRERERELVGEVIEEAEG